jgi:hypothetical protein
MMSVRETLKNGGEAADLAVEHQFPILAHRW